jgi:ferrous iron transport protein B
MAAPGNHLARSRDENAFHFQLEMTTPPPSAESTSDDRLSRVLLIGNPNVGKSALFNALTGLRATVSNYPGTTVELACGVLRSAPEAVEVVDSPGVNSLLPLSEDERVTWELVKASRTQPGTVVVLVADAKNLRRALLLTLQIGQLEIPAVLSLNMSDEAEAIGRRADVDGLSRALGIPVLRTVAIQGRGVEALRAALPLARPPSNHLPLADEVAVPVAAVFAGAAPLPDPEAPAPFVARYHEAMIEHAGILARRFGGAGATLRPATPRRGAAFSRRLGRVCTHPVWGWPVLLSVLFAVYQVVGVFGAGSLVGVLEDGLFRGHVHPWAKALFGRLPSAVVRDAFVGDYGVITMGLTYGLAIVLPIVTTFFLVFGLLEDSGYLPRLAVMSDRLLRAMGLNGRAVLPMVLGLGCDTMATLTTRILTTRKDRLLATLLLALGVPCSAQLGVILAMLARLPPSAVLLWAAVVAGVMLLVGRLGQRLLPGRTGEFVVELPPMRLPLAGNLFAKTAARVEWYLREALPLFVLGTLLLFALDRLRLLGAVIRAGEPLVTGVLGLPPEASEAFLVGFLRRDYAATRLFDLSRGNGLDTPQLAVAMVTITLFMPCIANALIIAKERGVKAALAMVAFIFPFAFAVGGAVRLLMRSLGPWGAP